MSKSDNQLRLLYTELSEPIHSLSHMYAFSLSFHHFLQMDNGGEFVEATLNDMSLVSGSKVLLLPNGTSPCNKTGGFQDQADDPMMDSN
jgi:hypothetical protein